MNVAVVIPTYNERDTLSRVLDGLRALGISGLNVWVVDDGSPDGTGAVADAYAAAQPWVRVIHRTGKLGLGSAYTAGFCAALDARTDSICTMDADLSHDPGELPSLVRAIDAGADVAVGSRKIPGGRIEGWGMHRHLMSNGAMTVARAALGLRTRDVTNGFRAYRRRVLEAIDLSSIRSDGYAFQEEMLYRIELAGFLVVEVPTIFRDRTVGESKLSAREIVQFFSTIVRLKL